MAKDFYFYFSQWFIDLMAFALFVMKNNLRILIKVLKTSTVKEPENVLITSFMVGRGPINGRTGDIINNLIIIYLNY